MLYFQLLSTEEGSCTGTVRVAIHPWHQSSVRDPTHWREQRAASGGERRGAAADDPSAPLLLLLDHVAVVGGIAGDHAILELKKGWTNNRTAKSTNRASVGGCDVTRSEQPLRSKSIWDFFASAACCIAHHEAVGMQIGPFSHAGASACGPSWLPSLLPSAAAAAAALRPVSLSSVRPHATRGRSSTRRR